MYLADSGNIYLGNDQDVTLTHVADTGINIKNTNTGNSKPVVLTLQTGETGIGTDEIIGTINFQAPDETEGGDAALVCAGIEAVAEADFSATANN